MPSPTAAPAMPQVDEVVVVAIGGVVGALARAGIGWLVPHSDPASWPWATFITNLVGCALLGLVLAFVDGRHERWLVTAPTRARLIRPLLATGVLGGFTTFSTFAVEIVRLIRADRVIEAGLYAALSVLLGIGLVAITRSAAGGWFGRTPIDLRADEEL